MKKKIFSVLLAAIMLVTVLATSFIAFAAPSTKATYKVDAVVSGDTLTVTVSVPGGIAAGGSCTIQYNTEKLTPVSGKSHVAGTYNLNFSKTEVFCNSMSPENFKEETLLTTFTFSINTGKVSASDIYISNYVVYNENSQSVGKKADGENPINFSCAHAKTSESRVEATCQTPGSVTTSCATCSEVLSTTAIPVTDHSYGAYAVTTNPGCESEGVETRTCSVCATQDTKTVPATGHTFGEYVETVKPGCETKGTDTRTCSACDKQETRDVPATGHTFGEWKVVKEFTCTEDGSEVRKCTACDKEETKVIPAAHTPGEDRVITKEATCTEEGSATSTCAKCAEKFTEVIPAKGHDFGEWVTDKEATADAEGSKHRDCKNCTAVETEVIAKLAPVTTAPSTGNNGTEIPKTGTGSVIAKTVIALFSVATLAGATVTGRKLYKKEK